PGGLHARERAADRGDVPPHPRRNGQARRGVDVHVRAAAGPRGLRMVRAADLARYRSDALEHHARPGAGCIPLSAIARGRIRGRRAVAAVIQHAAAVDRRVDELGGRSLPALPAGQRGGVRGRSEVVRLLRAGNVLRPGHVQVPGQMPAMAPAGVSIPPGRAARSGRGAVEGYRMSCGARGMTGTTPEEAAMLDLYYWPTPNGCKVTILLHELAASYNLIPLDIGKGDQFKPEFGR